MQMNALIMAVSRPGPRDLHGWLCLLLLCPVAGLFLVLSWVTAVCPPGFSCPLLPLRCNNCPLLKLALCLKSGWRTSFCLIPQLSLLEYFTKETMKADCKVSRHVTGHVWYPLVLLISEGLIPAG